MGCYCTYKWAGLVSGSTESRLGILLLLIGQADGCGTGCLVALPRREWVYCLVDFTILQRVTAI